MLISFNFASFLILKKRNFNFFRVREADRDEVGISIHEYVEYFSSVGNLDTKHIPAATYSIYSLFSLKSDMLSSLFDIYIGFFFFLSILFLPTTGYFSYSQPPYCGTLVCCEILS